MTICVYISLFTLAEEAAVILCPAIDNPSDVGMVGPIFLEELLNPLNSYQGASSKMIVVFYVRGKELQRCVYVPSGHHLLQAVNSFNKTFCCLFFVGHIGSYSYRIK